MKKGFTLLEILLVIAAIGILAAIVIVALNPTRQLSQVRNAQRLNDTRTLSQALDQYQIDQGQYPPGITDNYQEVCAIDAVDCTGFLDLSPLVPDYVGSIPSDPQATDPDGTGYEVGLSPFNDRISVRAPLAELENEVALNIYIDCPDGYIPVPGNAAYGTEDFCVGQFEAKSGGDSLAVGVPATVNGGFWALVGCTNNSEENGVPLDNEDWMTIARDIESQPENWISGQVGVGSMYRGYTLGTTGSGLAVADTNDPYNGTSGSPEQRRTYTLSTGYEIWDFSGNVAETLYDFVSGTRPVGSGGATPVEWTAVSNMGTYSDADFKASNLTWNSAQNIGQYIEGPGSTFVKGGRRSDTSAAGIYAHMFTSTFPQSDIGYRCKLDAEEAALYK